MRRSVAIGHPDFGEVFPCRCQQDQSHGRRPVQPQLREIGGFSLEMLERMSFQNFNPHGSTRSDQREDQETLKKALEAAKFLAHSPGGWLFLTGVHGNGKTHLAVAVAGKSLKQGGPVFLAFVPSLLDHLRATFSPESRVTYDELFEEVKTAPWLLLDDLGAENSTPWAEDKLYQLLVYRHNLRIPTIITSALDADEIEVKKPGVGSRLKDPHVVQEIVITASDYRDQRRVIVGTSRPRRSRI